MHSFDELVMAAQQSDLKQEEDRLAREKAEKAAWLAKAKAPGTYNASQLLEKMVGNGAEGVVALPTPAPERKPEVKKENADARFPPPPTSRR